MCLFVARTCIALFADTLCVMHGGEKVELIIISRHMIRAVALSWIFMSSAPSQEPYASNANAASASFSLGRYNTDNKWGFGISYSLKGLLQLSYTRSSILTNEHIDNFQNEYFLRFYAPQQKRFFVSFGVGYLYQKASRDLWKNYPLVFISNGVGFQGGLHLVTEDTKTTRVVVSVLYTYFEPDVELRTPEVRLIQSMLARSISCDVGIIYYLGQIGFVVGPSIALDSDFKNAFFGLQSSFLIRH